MNMPHTKRMISQLSFLTHFFCVRVTSDKSDLKKKKMAAAVSSSAVASGEMVPITRELLKKCYDKYPIAPPSAALVAMDEEVAAAIKAFRTAIVAADPAAEATTATRHDGFILKKPPHKVFQYFIIIFFASFNFH